MLFAFPRDKRSNLNTIYHLIIYRFCSNLAFAVFASFRRILFLFSIFLEILANDSVNFGYSSVNSTKSDVLSTNNLQSSAAIAVSFRNSYFQKFNILSEF